MKTIRYLGPGDVLRVGKTEIPRGETGEVTNDQAEELLTAPYVSVELAEPAKKPESEEKEE